MICPGCNIEKPEKDFVLHKKCYKCVYAEKSKFSSHRKCLVCDSYCPSERMKYCSEECMNVVAKKKKQDFWTKKLI